MRYRTKLMESILTSPQAQKIIDYLTPIYGEAYVFLWILQSIGVVLDEGYTFVDEFINQVTPSTATWTIEFWEKEYGIIPYPSWSIEQRRENIISTMHYKAPINPKKMEDMVSAIVGLPVQIYENTGKNTFTVNILGYTQEYSRAIEAIEKMKPAHIIYDIRVSEKAQSILNDYYKIFVTELTNLSVFIIPEKADPYVRIADEKNNILLDENGGILVY